MTEEEESFKVSDRRGRARDSDAPPPAEGRPSAAGTAPAEGRPSAAGTAPAEASVRPGPSAAPEPAAPDLQGLFLTFASSALVNLGQAPDPVTGERRMDLDQAREAIDVLLLLRSKTSGNRTEEESRLLDEILYNLQMLFVQATDAKRPH